MKKNNLQKGSGLVEILVAVFIFTLILTSLITASNLYLSGSEESLKIAEGAYIAQEGVEAVKIMRDVNWTNISSLTNDSKYYFVFDTSSSTNNIWKATTTASYENMNSFLRSFKVSAVYRDSNGDIASSGSLDQYTKKVVVSVSWKSKSATTTKTISTYIANIL
jgi:Tfp pilus assembly protein PilV